MTTSIELREWADWEGDLAEEDVAFIDSELSRKISIRRDALKDLYVINPGQYVGVVTLPSRRRLESYPKVPVRNLFFMLAVAFDFPSPFREQVTRFDRLDQILEFVASYFADLVNQRIDRGLYRSYEETEENLSAVRGRINFTEDVRHNYVLRHRTFCRFAEFTWDIPENQIIRQVAHMLTGWSFRRGVRNRLARIDAALADVTTTLLPASAMDRFRYHRLNDDYRQLHQLCRLFLEGASVSEDFGAFNYRTFLLDMNRLFETFVTQVLRDRARSGISLRAQMPTHLGQDKKVLMRPDITLWRAGSVALVADCKYKRIESEEYKNYDMYQLLAYCTAARVARGLLIYPRHVSDVSDVVRVRNSDIVIRQTSIDLGKADRELVSECDRFANEVFARATDPSRTPAAMTGLGR